MHPGYSFQIQNCVKMPNLRRRLMRKRNYPVMLVVVYLALIAIRADAVDDRLAVSRPASSNVQEGAIGTNTGKIARRKSAAAGKLVDINGAKREALMKLPGIGKAEAGRIIAGRPYATKAHLVAQNVINRGQYEKIRRLIVARQPYRDGAKNAALYQKQHR